VESILSEKSPEERTRTRKELEVPILNSFWEWLEKQKPVSGSRFAAAVYYAKNQKPVMENYLLDGRIALSNAIALSEGITYPHLFSKTRTGSGFFKKRCA
jgi:hypothetical protein